MAAELRDRRASKRRTLELVGPVDHASVDEAAGRLMREVAELTRSNEQLTAFAHAAAHDMCGPLAAIAGTAELLVRMVGADLDEDAQNVLAALLHSVKKMDRHLHSLLDGAQPRLDADRQLVDCDGVVTSVLAGLPELGAEVRRERLGRVLGHRSLIEQVFEVLLTRAAWYRSPDVPFRIEIGVREAEGGRIFSVADNGVSAVPGASDGAGDTSTRLAAIDGGAAFDLAYCRWAVRGHGGRIWMEPRPGGGTTVSFFLPTSDT